MISEKEHNTTKKLDIQLEPKIICTPPTKIGDKIISMFSNRLCKLIWFSEKHKTITEIVYVTNIGYEFWSYIEEKESETTMISELMINYDIIESPREKNFTKNKCYYSDLKNIRPLTESEELEYKLLYEKFMQKK